MITEKDFSNLPIAQKIEYYRLRAHRKARAHYLATKYHERWNILLGVPGVIATTIVGTAIFATVSQKPAMPLQILAGVLSLTAAVLVALQTFFKHSENAEKNRIAAASYASVFRKLDMLKLQENWKGDPDSEQMIFDKLQSAVSEIDQLEKESPDSPDRFYDQAVKEQANDKEGV